MSEVPAADRCFWHGYEPIPWNHYVVCGECGHVFVTASELLDDFNAARPPGAPQETDVSRIFFCPLCVHDF